MSFNAEINIKLIATRIPSTFRPWTFDHAEGIERGSDKDFARFLDIAKASCGEVRSMLYLAEDLKYIDSKESKELRDKAVSISKGISALSKHLRR